MRGLREPVTCHQGDSKVASLHSLELALTPWSPVHCMSSAENAYAPVDAAKGSPLYVCG